MILQDPVRKMRFKLLEVFQQKMNKCFTSLRQRKTATKQADSRLRRVIMKFILVKHNNALLQSDKWTRRRAQLKHNGLDVPGKPDISKLMDERTNSGQTDARNNTICCCLH